MLYSFHSTIFHIASYHFIILSTSHASYLASKTLLIHTSERLRGRYDGSASASWRREAREEEDETTGEDNSWTSIRQS